MDKAQTWYLYVIATHRGTLYTGITPNVEKRFLEHQLQSPKCAKYLRGKQPLTLVFQQQIGVKSKALQLEQKFKCLTKKQKHQIIDLGFIDIEQF